MFPQSSWYAEPTHKNKLNFLWALVLGSEGRECPCPWEVHQIIAYRRLRGVLTFLPALRRDETRSDRCTLLHSLLQCYEWLLPLSNKFHWARIGVVCFFRGKRKNLKQNKENTSLKSDFNYPISLPSDFFLMTKLYTFCSKLEITL